MKISSFLQRTLMCSFLWAVRAQEATFSVSPSTQIISEGSAADISITIVEGYTSETRTATIDFGDGSSEQTIQKSTIGNETATLFIQHTYGDWGDSELSKFFSISVSVDDLEDTTTDTPVSVEVEQVYPYKIGVGKNEITDGAIGIGLQGWADSDQKTTDGPFHRIYARAYIIEENDNPSSRITMVVTDNWAATDRVKREVIERLDDAGHGSGFSQENFMLMANHAHSAPGGYSDWKLYENQVGGFDEHNFECIVLGIVSAIASAEDNMLEGDIYANVQDVTKSEGVAADVAWQRSADAYEENEDKDDYTDSVDYRMWLLKLTHQNIPVGMINWFAVHPTSLGQYFKRTAGDNKGYANYLFETEFPGVIGTFANAHAGDVSGNEPYQSNLETSDAGYVARMIANGGKQAQAASKLYTDATTKLEGSISFRWQRQFMADYEIEPGKKTSSGALGYSFAAGSKEDGFAVPDLSISEGMPFGQVAGDEGELAKAALLITAMNLVLGTSFDIEYARTFGEHLPKFVVAAPGLEGATPEILPFQMFKIGELAIAGCPGELTTMSGRRLMKTIAEADTTINSDFTIVAGYANEYSQYITTQEEYNTQHYEGASTLFGPYTLEAYQDIFANLATAMANNQAVQAGPERSSTTAGTLKRTTIRNTCAEDLSIEIYNYDDLLAEVKDCKWKCKKANWLCKIGKALFKLVCTVVQAAATPRLGAPTTAPASSDLVYNNLYDLLDAGIYSISFDDRIKIKVDDEHWVGTLSNPVEMGDMVVLGCDFAYKAQKYTPWWYYWSDDGSESTVRQAPSVTSTAVEPINEGQEASFTISISDEQETVSFSVVIDWDDGSSSTESLSAPTGVATWTVSHTYKDDPGAEAGDEYEVDVRVSDSQGNKVDSSARVSVFNVSPSVSLTSLALDENQVAKLDVTISDPGVQDSFVLDIYWGDEASDTDISVGSSSTGSQTLSYSHQYLDNGEYNVRVDVIDNGQGFEQVSTTFVVNNVAPTVAATSATIDENEVASIDVMVTDPGTLDSFELEVNWGDSHTSNYALLPSADGSQTQTLLHKYLDDGPSSANSFEYPVSITVVDKDDGEGTTETSVTVNNVETTVSIVNETPIINENDVAEFTLTVQDPGTRDTFWVNVDYGDGSPTDVFALEASATGSQTVALKHLYLDDGPANSDTLPFYEYSVIVSVVDDDEGSGEASTVARVNNVAPQITVTALTPSIDENDDATIQVVVEDPGTEDTFSVFIDWKDGHDDGGSNWEAHPIEKSSTGVQTLTYTHQFLDDGYGPGGSPSFVYDIVVVVLDDDGGSAEQQEVITVNNLNPTASIDSLVDELGRPIGYDSFFDFVLTYIDQTLTMSFADVGSLDTHKATIDWKDATVSEFPDPASTPFSGSHAYTEEGIYNVELTVEDDDKGAVTVSRNLRILSATSGLGLVIPMLESCTADVELSDKHKERDLEQALSHLRGNVKGNGDKGKGKRGLRASRNLGAEPSNGALNMLERENWNAGAVKIWLAMKLLVPLEDEIPQDSYRSLESMLVSIVKSVLLDGLERTVVPSSSRVIVNSMIAAGNEYAQTGKYLEAAERYRLATSVVYGDFSAVA